MTDSTILDARTERDLIGVHPDLQRIIRQAYAVSPVKFIITEGLRSIEKQRENVRKGASQTMNSRHLTGHAVDVAALDPKTHEVSWTWSLYQQIADVVLQVAKEEGVAVTWGGSWKMRDGPHFELQWGAYPA